MEPLRLAQTGWLAGLSQIKMVDEGHLKWARLKIAQGVYDFISQCPRQPAPWKDDFSFCQCTGPQTR